MFEAANGANALATFHRQTPVLVVLDVDLEDVSGLEVCRELRVAGEVPIVFLTSSAQGVDELIGYAAGGDGYVMRPASADLLIAHLEALLGLGQRDPSPNDSLSVGALSLN